MKRLKKLRLKNIFTDNLDGYDVALAIIGGVIGVVGGTLIFMLFFQ